MCTSRDKNDAVAAADVPLYAGSGRLLLMLLLLLLPSSVYMNGTDNPTQNSDFHACIAVSYVANMIRLSQG